MDWQRRLSYVGLALTLAAATYVIGAVLGALATSEPGGVTASRRFEFLSRAADPVPAALLLLGVLAVLVAEEGSPVRAMTARIAVGTAAFFGVVVALLAVNGVLLDLTADGARPLVRLSRVIFLRLGPMLLAGFTVWLSLSAQARPDTPSPEAN